MNANEIWTQACSYLRKKLRPDIYSRWIEVIQAREIRDNNLLLGVGNDFYHSWLENHYLPILKESVAAAGGEGLEIKFVVDPSVGDEIGQADRERQRKRKRAPVETGARTNNLNSDYIFDSFVVGPSNGFAHASCIAVAQSPGRAYNPLFIYGGSGLGKTHLMQAIGHFVLSQQPSCSVCYLSCESLMNEYVAALQNKKILQFREKYRSTDVLLVDDIHFLTGKDALQEEFFHTFNNLFDSRKQIVITSDRPVNEISGLTQRLVSRFAWGLVTELTPPDFETRLAILQFKQNKLNIALQKEILEFIAINVRANIRLLEGAMKRLASYASFMKTPLTVSLAESLLRDIINSQKRDPVTIDNIQKKVADYFDVRMSDMISKRRSQAVAFPRQVAMYLCRSLTPFSLPEIGSAFGKTHATVLHSYRLIHDKIGRDQQFRLTVEKLSSSLSSE